MKIFRSKCMHASTAALVLALTIAATLITCAPVTFGQEKITVWAYVATVPKTIGRGQSIYIVGWVSPAPHVFAAVYHDYAFTITKPNGVTDTKVMDSDSPGTASFGYVCDQLGTWSVILSWGGDEKHEAAISDPATWTVQEEPVPPYPMEPLPIGPWEYPISAEYYEWYQISGAWPMDRYNASCSPFNPYSTGPNSPHVLYKLQTGAGGLVGGEEGYLSNTRPSIASPVAAYGRLYYATSEGLGDERHPVLHCVDQFTGELIYERDLSGAGSGGGLALEISATIKGDPQLGEGESSIFALWVWGGGIWQVDPWTGDTLYYWEEEGVDSWSTLYHDHAMYIMNYPEPTNLTKWDCRTKEIAWTTQGVFLPGMQAAWQYTVEGAFTGLGYIWKDVIVQPIESWGGIPICLKIVTFNATTGELLVNGTDIGVYPQENAVGKRHVVGYGKYFFHGNDMKVHAVSLYTGKEVWESEPWDAPWGCFGSYSNALAYGNVYEGSYDGYLYAYNAETGNLEWKFYSGNTTETAFGSYPWWGPLVIADGKVYAATGEHTPPSPLPRGHKLWCLDAYTGDLIWSYSGIQCRGSTNGGISSGILWYANAYDGCLWFFGKGPSATTVSASPSVITNGTSVLIRGTVTDQTPAQKDTPCVSKESMAPWMEHLHNNAPAPEDVTGVPVQLVAISSGGDVVDIGWVTSDSGGCFNYLWTPTTEDVYTIVANFAGDESYYGSWGETAVGVTAAPEEPTVEPTEEPAYTAIDLAIIAAVVVVAILVLYTLWTVRKLRK